MITDRDNERRDGYSSSTNRNGQGEVKKKRPRVGDTRTTVNRESSNYNNNRSNNNSYQSNRDSGSGGYQRGGGSGYQRSGGSGYQSGGGYQGGDRNNNNRRPVSRNQNQRGAAPTGQKFMKKPKQLVKPVKYKENIDPDTLIRLNKYLANAGVCSRREADAYIAAGVVKVNGEVVNELGTKVRRGDMISFHDQPVRLESKVYVLLNKPKNTVTTSDDPQNRKTVMDLVKGACPERIYPVGRLDRNTTGVLLLTNDGDLASKLMHPKYVKKKIYQVRLDRDVAIEDMQAIADGIELDDGEIHADSIAYVGEDVLNEVGLEIHSGRNRIVRRIFEKLGYQVLKLDRVYFAGLTKKNLGRGKWRYLSAQEVNMLRMGAFE